MHHPALVAVRQPARHLPYDVARLRLRQRPALDDEVEQLAALHELRDDEDAVLRLEERRVGSKQHVEDNEEEKAEEEEEEGDGE